MARWHHQKRRASMCCVRHKKSSISAAAAAAHSQQKVQLANKTIKFILISATDVLRWAVAQLQDATKKS